MSAKYNQHPMEAKAEADIKAAKSERETVALSYSAWLEFWQKSSDSMPTAFQYFRAGWTEAMEFVRIIQAPASPVQPAPPLTWTKEKPKVDGWYCYRTPGAKAWQVTDIRMFTGAPCWHSNERNAWVGVWPNMEWAGPIPEPQAQPIPPEAGT